MPGIEPSKLTVAQLKRELQKRNLPQNGIKADLVKRLTEDMKKEDQSTTTATTTATASAMARNKKDKRKAEVTEEEEGEKDGKHPVKRLRTLGISIFMLLMVHSYCLVQAKRRTRIERKMRLKKKV